MNGGEGAPAGKQTTGRWLYKDMIVQWGGPLLHSIHGLMFGDWRFEPCMYQQLAWIWTSGFVVHTRVCA